MHNGPKVYTDGLVFGYDTGAYADTHDLRDKRRPHNDTKPGRFYRGKPVTNFIAYQNAVRTKTLTSYSATSSGTWNAKHPNAIRAYNAQGTDITAYINTGVTDWTNTYHAHWQFDKILKKPVVVMDCFDSNWKAKFFDCNTAAWSTYGMTTGSKYVISWLQWTSNTNKYLSAGIYSKNTSGTRNFYDGRSGNEASVKNTKPFTWQRVYKVYTVASTHDVTQDYQRIYMYGHYGTNGVGVTVKIADVQLELNTDHPSSFLDSKSDSSSTTRSSTESLFDISGKNTNIDVSNVSYDSNGFIDFDGTGDYIQAGTHEPFTLSNRTATWEAVVKFDSTSANAAVITRWENSVGETWWFGRYSSARVHLALRIGGGYQGLYSSSSMTSNSKYYHIAAVLNGTSVNFFIDGKLDRTVSVNAGSWSNNTGTLPNTTIGAQNDGGANLLNGQIPIIKLYDRVLTAPEVKQNFNSYRKRFNL